MCPHIRMSKLNKLYTLNMCSLLYVKYVTKYVKYVYTRVFFSIYNMLLKVQKSCKGLNNF